MEGKVRIEGASDIQDVQVSGDWAYVWTQLTITMHPVDGSAPTHRSGPGLSVWRKKADGRWVIFRDANMVTSRSNRRERKDRRGTRRGTHCRSRAVAAGRPQVAAFGRAASGSVSRWFVVSRCAVPSQSARSAMIGSIRDARSDGSRQASAATSAKVTATAA